MEIKKIIEYIEKDLKSAGRTRDYHKEGLEEINNKIKKLSDMLNTIRGYSNQ